MGLDDLGWVGRWRNQEPTLLRVVETNPTRGPNVTPNPDAGRKARLSPRPPVLPCLPSASRKCLWGDDG
eukprot:2124450-Pleurochrysis_carterae.AAC.1